LDPVSKKRRNEEPGHRRNETGNLRDSIEIGVEPRDKDATAIVSFKKDIGPNDNSSEHDLNATHGSMNKGLLSGVVGRAREQKEKAGARRGEEVGDLNPDAPSSNYRPKKKEEEKERIYEDVKAED
jgi:hypothetical protein